MRLVVQGAGLCQRFARFLELAVEILPIGTGVERDGIFEALAIGEERDGLIADAADFGDMILGGRGEDARVVVDAPFLGRRISFFERGTAERDDAVRLGEFAAEAIGDDGRIQDVRVFLNQLRREAVGIADDEVEALLGDEAFDDGVEDAGGGFLIRRLDVVKDRFLGETVGGVPFGDLPVTGENFLLRHFAAKAREQHLPEDGVETEPAVVHVHGREEETQVLDLAERGFAAGAAGNRVEKFGADAFRHAGFEKGALYLARQVFKDVGGEEVDQVGGDTGDRQGPRPARAAAHGQADTLKRGGPAIRRNLILIQFLVRDVAKFAEEFRGFVGAETQALDVHDDGLLAQLEARQIDRRDDARADAELRRFRHDADELRNHGFHAGMRGLFEIVDDDDDAGLDGTDDTEEILDGSGRAFGKGNRRIVVAECAGNRLAEKAEKARGIGVVRLQMQPGGGTALALAPAAILTEQRRLAETRGRLHDDEPHAGMVFQAIELMLAEHKIVRRRIAPELVREGTRQYLFPPCPGSRRLRFQCPGHRHLPPPRTAEASRFPRTRFNAGLLPSSSFQAQARSFPMRTMSLPLLPPV